VLLRHLVTVGPVLAGLLTACGPSGSNPPTLDPMDDHTAYVAVELSVSLRASDVDGDDLSYRFEATGPSEIGERGQIRPYNDGSTAVFRWTPLAGDVGTWNIEFIVTDGSGESRETIRVDVQATTGENRPPAFHRPLGTGSTLELAKEPCAEVVLEIEDPDNTDVVLSQKEPVLEGATLEQTSSTTGAFRWCPTVAQIAQGERYTVVFLAEDGQNPPQEKPFTIVLRKTQRSDCPGAGPVITHTPMDVDSVNPLTVFAQITDDQAVDASPLFYFSDSDPGDDPDISSMAQLEMLDMEDGNHSYGAAPPNPVATMPAGSSVTLYYVIVAQDRVDPETGCNHLAQMPATGAYQMVVTNPGTEGGRQECESCTADMQCGGNKDHCITVGSGNFCGSACTGDTDCPSSYVCSPSPMTSVGGISSRQCVPASGACTAGPGDMCVDDNREENDTLAAATSKPALTLGTALTGMKTCPGVTAGTDDPDWYRVVVTEGELDLVLDGTASTDLELHLYSSAGLPIASSVSSTSHEEVSACLAPGTYYARVSTWSPGTGQNTYTLTPTHTPKVCADARENDDTPATATNVTFTSGKWTDTNRSITANDDDYHKVSLTAGQTLRARMTFDGLAGDLDFHLVRVVSGAEQDLTPCEESNGGEDCEPVYGQSGSAPENLTYAITATGTYYVVVHGWAGDENRYDICLTTANNCP
jgi:hypothetical protein